MAARIERPMTRRDGRDLIEAATPLPWEYGFDDGSGKADTDDGGWLIAERDRVAVRGGHDDYGIPHGVLTDGDAALIVYAVNNLPALLDVRDALERLLDVNLIEEEDVTAATQDEWAAALQQAVRALARLQEGEPKE